MWPGRPAGSSLGYPGPLSLSTKHPNALEESGHPGAQRPAHPLLLSWHGGVGGRELRGSSARNVAALGSHPPLQVPLCCPLPVTSLLPTASARLGAHVGPLGRTPGSVQPPPELEGRLDQTRSRAGHPTKHWPSSALLSTGTLEWAPGLLALHGTWPRDPQDRHGSGEPARGQWLRLPAPPGRPVGAGALTAAGLAEVWRAGGACAAPAW